MNKEKALTQLKDLLYSFENFEEIETKNEDVQALKYAVDQLEKTAPEVKVQEQFTQQEAKQLLIKHFKQFASRNDLCNEEFRNMIELYFILFPYHP